MTDLFPGRAAFRQLVEWGYPQGRLRPALKPAEAFSVIHVTGNPGNPIASAAGELAWRIGDKANQNSATFFVDRNGAVHQALGDPARMDPWSNGDAKSPDMKNPRIAACIRAGINPNQRTLISIENVGRPTDLPITGAQIEANARLLAHYHGRAGVPITRETVVGHYQINAVARANCPAIDKRVIDTIVARAAALRGVPDNAIEEKEDDMTWRQYARLTAPHSITVKGGAIPYAGPGREHGEHSAGFSFKEGEQLLSTVIVTLPGNAGQWYGCTRGGNDTGLFWLAKSAIAKVQELSAPTPPKDTSAGATTEQLAQARYEAADAVALAARESANDFQP